MWSCDAARPSFGWCQPISVDLNRSTELVVKATTAAATDTSFPSKRVEEKCVNFAWRDSYIAAETRGVVQMCHLVVFVSTQCAERRIAMQRL